MAGLFSRPCRVEGARAVAPVQRAATQEVESGHVGRTLGEEVSQLGGHTRHVAETGGSHLPRRTETGGELEPQSGVVDPLGGLEMAMEAAAVERRPTTVHPLGDVRHHQMGVEVGVERPARAVEELPGHPAGHGEQVGSTLAPAADGQCGALEVAGRIGHRDTVSGSGLGGELAGCEQMEDAHRFRRTERKVIRGDAPGTCPGPQRPSRAGIVAFHHLGERLGLDLADQTERRRRGPAPDPRFLARDEGSLGTPRDETLHVVVVAALVHHMDLQHLGGRIALGSPLFGGTLRQGAGRNLAGGPSAGWGAAGGPVGLPSALPVTGEDASGRVGPDGAVVLGLEHRCVGTESEEQTFEPGLASDDDLDLETVPHPPRRARGRDGLDLPPDPRIDREQHLPVVGTRHVRRVGRRCRDVRAGPLGRADLLGGGDAVHPEPPHVTRRSGTRRRRTSDPRWRTAGAGRCGVRSPGRSRRSNRRCRPSGGPRSPSRTVSSRAGASSSTPTSFASERPVELGERTGEGAALVAPGDGDQGAGGGGEGESLGRAEATGPGQCGPELHRHRGVGHHDLHQLVGRVRGHPAAGGHLELGHQRLGREVEPCGRLVDRRLAHLGQPGQDGQQPPQPAGGVGRLAHRSVASRRPTAIMASSRASTAARRLGRTEHLGVVEQVEHPEDQRVLRR